MFDTLTYHGKTREACEWVLNNFANNPFYTENEGVQLWVAESKAFLDALEEDERWDKAVESKFGTDR